VLASRPYALMASVARAAELFCNATSSYLSELSRYGRWPLAAQFVPEGVPGGGALSPISATRIFPGALMLGCMVVLSIVCQRYVFPVLHAGW
jgi:hypothetical protein